MCHGYLGWLPKYGGHWEHAPLVALGFALRLVGHVIMYGETWARGMFPEEFGD